MADFKEGCGCVSIAFCGVMLLVGIISAISNGSSHNSSSTPKIDYTPPAPAPTYTPPVNYHYTPSSIQTQPVRTSSSFTPDDAYDEGYDEGYEQGVEDGRRGRSHGYGYDDSNDYYNHYETMYCDGYSSGYDEGYSSGHNDYEDHDEDEDYDY